MSPRRWERNEKRQTYGVACLAYTLFESLVDGYFVVQDRVRERMEGIEEAIFRGADRGGVPDDIPPRDWKSWLKGAAQKHGVRLGVFPQQFEQTLVVDPLDYLLIENVLRCEGVSA